MVPLKGGVAVDPKGNAKSGIDAYEMATAEEIFAKFPEKWTENLLQ